MKSLVVVGATASGKSAVALAIARALGDVELVSVDSMQVYRGMNIGTAKPTTAEQQIVRHHLIDLVDPEEDFTVGRFQRAARAALADIAARGRRALLVGGTGLYLRSIIDDLEIPGRFPDVRAALDAEADTALLFHRLHSLDPAAAARMEPTNRRRVVRALEVCLGAGRPFSSFGPGLASYPAVDFELIGLSWPRETLDARIEARYQDQMRDGFLEEVTALAHRPGTLSASASQALGYRELFGHLAGQCSVGEALAEATRRTRRFARRQERWFRRDPRIRWLPGNANPLVPTAQVLRD